MGRFFNLCGAIIGSMCFCEGVLAITVDNSRWLSIGSFFVGISMFRFFGVIKGGWDDNE